MSATHVIVKQLMLCNCFICLLNVTLNHMYTPVYWTPVRHSFSIWLQLGSVQLVLTKVPKSGGPDNTDDAKPWRYLLCPTRDICHVDVSSYHTLFTRNLNKQHTNTCVLFVLKRGNIRLNSTQRQLRTACAYNVY